MRPSTPLLAAALATLSGCGCAPEPAGAVTDCASTRIVPAVVELDVLFVVDDSLSMREEQENLRANLGAFIDGLVASPVEQRFRVGVTSSSVEGFVTSGGAGQRYGAGPAADVPYPDGALVAVVQAADGAVVPGDLDYTVGAGFGGARILDRDSPTLAGDFRANVQLGTSGSGKEQPFRAARLALSERLADSNAGFLRPGARLAVIFVTDEDDCSDTAAPTAGSNAECHDPAVKAADPPVLDPPEALAAFLLGPVDGELREVTVGVIAGFDPVSLAPSCGDAALCANTACQTAFDQGTRFARLAALLGGARTRLGSICDQSFAQTLRGFAEVLIPSTVPLSGTPADWRMLAVTVTRAGGAAVACRVAAEGTPGADGADAVYAPPRFGRPAQLTLGGGCAPALGDRIDVRLVCVE